MRNIINISLPETLAKEVEKEVEKGDFASKSEFFRHLLRDYRKRELAKELNRDRKLFDLGKGRELRSLRDLRSK